MCRLRYRQTMYRQTYLVVTARTNPPLSATSFAMPLVRLPDAAGNTLLLMEYGPDNYRGPPDSPEERMAQVHKIDVRDDDVVLLSYPKSGCHWLWEMARMILAGHAVVETQEKEKTMMEFASWEEMDKLPSPRVFNTHFRFHEMPDKVQDGKVKLLFIYRNPKDVAVSFYHHHVKFPEYEYKGDFKDYLLGLFLKGDTDFGDYFQYAKHWQGVFSQRPHLPVFVLSYEELHHDTMGKARELAQFLGVTLDEHILQEIVTACSFTSMQERKGKQWTAQYGEPVMYRKGKVGDWKNWFTVAQSEMVDELAHRHLNGSKLYKLEYTL